MKQPPLDYKCEMCKKIQKNKTLCYINGYWICVFLDCQDKAKKNGADENGD